jgi:aconitate hydratase
VKTSLAPGSQVVTEYLRSSGLQKDLDKIGFNSSAMAAPLASATPARCPRTISKAINDNDLVAAAVLSGNRNFEGRVNPDVRPIISPRRRWLSPMRWPAR